MKNVYEKFAEAATVHENRPAVHWKEKKAWHTLNYATLLGHVDGLAASLRSLGVTVGSHLAILSENRPEWLVSDLAINKLGAVSVPIHYILNQRLIEFILKDSGSEYLIASNDMFGKHKGFLRHLGLKKIVVIGEGDTGTGDDGSLVFFKDLLTGAGESGAEKASGTGYHKDDLASIIYTSGTTAEPKGVILTNRMFLSNIEAIGKRLEIYETDVFLSFLPLSHIFERTVGSYVCVVNGASVAYTENIKTLPANLREVGPTALVSVPKVFEAFQEKVLMGIRHKNPIIGRLFFRALQKNKYAPSRLLAEWLIFRKVRASLGGRLRLAVSGGAGIHPEILGFFRNIGVNIIEGYGLTETSPVISTNSPTRNKVGTVGQPLEGVMVKIGHDREILVKGESVTPGYWKNSEATGEAFDEDGWFKTGDLGSLDSENFLSIVGRKKEIIVTSNGKNVAPAPIEWLLNASPFVSQSLVVGNDRKYLTALIVPDMDAVRSELGDKDADLHDLMKKEIRKVNAQLLVPERIIRFHIIETPFTVDNEELTPTLKLRRSFIQEKYTEAIEGMYK
jgi:long-chain acyl-CoA synthetase